MRSQVRDMVDGIGFAGTKLSLQDQIAVADQYKQGKFATGAAMM